MTSGRVKSSGGAENPDRAGTSAKGLVIFLAKLLVSALLVAFVLSRLSLEDIRAAMQSPRWGWLVAAFGVYAVSAAGGAMQWAWILKAAGIRAPGREIRRLYFIGLFFNNFLPANIGGDAYKIVDLGRREQRATGVFCATLVDRLLGLTALTFLAVIFLIAAAVAGVPLPGLSLALIPLALALAVGLACLLSRRLGRWVPRLARRVGLGGVADWLAGVTAELAIYRPRVRWLNGIFLFSMLVQTLRMATHLLVAFGLGHALGWQQMVQLMVLVPMLALSLILPITINGIGLRESVAGQLLVFSGLAEGPVVAIEVVAFLIQVVFSLQGGLLLWWGKSQTVREKSGA
ncbi:hypothetical protein CSA17_06780 [bacterium DOLJORAL78_65_58]|nr:MAG: hypothetical protein CSB20_14175 [bacterium DOLZORAL124_64_63]PIE75568.1 MAG: hypothetical protein CSA17_06780 [bacterium DOLJORAL78_65_58]